MAPLGAVEHGIDIPEIMRAVPLVYRNEETLYDYAFNETSIENSKLMIVQYIENYEGINIEHTINILYKYCSYCCRLFNDDYKSNLIKGIMYSDKYKIYKIPTFLYINEESNLFFYYELARFFENQKNFNSALYYYEQTRELYVKYNGKYNYRDAMNFDNSVKDLDGKIYGIKLILSK